MFTSLTTRNRFGATYQWAILSVLPMDDPESGDTYAGMRPVDVNRALGLPNDARTGLSMLLKSMARQGLVKRYEYSPRIVGYTALCRCGSVRESPDGSGGVTPSVVQLTQFTPVFHAEQPATL